MSPQRYERVRRLSPVSEPSLHPLITTNTLDLQVAEYDEDESPISPHPQNPIPNSPPPSFRSRASSPTSRRLLSDDPLATDAERTLADTFDSPSDDEDSDDEHGDGMDDRQRLMRGNPSDSRNDDQTDRQSDEVRPRGLERRVTQLPAFTPQPASGHGRVYGGGQNDGVFANLSAKPSRSDDLEEKPPVCHIPLSFRTHARQIYGICC